MTKIYKICLILALFICSASVAWAGINYDSLENHYLIDSVLRVDGDYIMIGDATPTGTMLGQTTTDSFLLISGNLVFLGQGPFDAGLDRKIGIFNNESYLQTDRIRVTSTSNNFNIATSAGPIIISSPTITMNKNFKILNNQGITLLSEAQQSISLVRKESITVEKVLTKNLYTINDENFTIKEGVQLSVNAGSTTFDPDEGRIILGGDHFCKLIAWKSLYMYENSFVAKKERGEAWAANNGDQTNRTPCPVDGGEAYPTAGGGNQYYAAKTCCPKNYLVFDMNITNPRESGMVCCRASKMAFED